MKPPILHHLTYSVADVERLSAWYIEVLGFRLARRFSLRDGAMQFAWLDIADFRIGMIQTDGEVIPNRPVVTAGESLAIAGVRHVVFSVASVDDAYRELVRKGVVFLEAPASFEPPGIRIAYLQDPEGNVLGLYEDLDPANAIAGD